MTVGAKAGTNGENHNHNDIGSYILHKGRSFFLTDPGAPVYSKKTFSGRRYESVYCNSFGHSVPVINGRRQSEGSRFRGEIRADGLDGDGPKTLAIAMAGAYDDPTLVKLDRTLTLAPDGRRLTLVDTYAFTEPPTALEEAFITTLAATVDPDGRSVVIRSPQDGALRLRAEGVAGRFAVTELTEESRESRTGELLRRITFTPGTRTAAMTLRFTATFE